MSGTNLSSLVKLSIPTNGDRAFAAVSSTARAFLSVQLWPEIAFLWYLNDPVTADATALIAAVFFFVASWSGRSWRAPAAVSVTGNILASLDVWKSRSGGCSQEESESKEVNTHGGGWYAPKRWEKSKIRSQSRGARRTQCRG